PEYAHAESWFAMGLLWRSIRIEWIDAVVRGRSIGYLGSLRFGFRRLDEARRSGLEHDSSVCRKEFAESPHALVQQLLQGIRSGHWFCLAGSLARHWKNNGAWRLSAHTADPAVGKYVVLRSYRSGQLGQHYLCRRRQQPLHRSDRYVETDTFK